MEGRSYTSMKKLVLKYDLGPAIAGNFYLCEYDPQSDKTIAMFEYFPEYVLRAAAQAGAESSEGR